MPVDFGPLDPLSMQVAGVICMSVSCLAAIVSVEQFEFRKGTRQSNWDSPCESEKEEVGSSGGTQN
ncbi:hypothetical protein B0H12DRAFT_752123 [Mycena haematopus]|nr:hypothetical protein B0H12DRAFT_752123 [Mycena haematopus]